MPFCLLPLYRFFSVSNLFSVMPALLAAVTFLLSSKYCFASILFPFFLFTWEHYQIWMFPFFRMRRYRDRYALSLRSEWLMIRIRKLMRMLFFEAALTRVNIVETHWYLHWQTMLAAHVSAYLHGYRSFLQRRFARRCGRYQVRSFGTVPRFLMALGLFRVVTGQEITEPVGFAAASEDGSGLSNSIRLLHFNLPFNPFRSDCDIFNESSLHDFGLF